MVDVKANRPHFHVWRMATGDRAFFRLARGFHTRQAARQFAKRRDTPERLMVLQCERTACALCKLAG